MSQVLPQKNKKIVVGVVNLSVGIPLLLYVMTKLFHVKKVLLSSFDNVFLALINIVKVTH